MVIREHDKMVRKTMFLEQVNCVRPITGGRMLSGEGTGIYKMKHRNTLQPH